MKKIGIKIANMHLLKVTMSIAMVVYLHLALPSFIVGLYIGKPIEFPMVTLASCLMLPATVGLYFCCMLPLTDADSIRRLSKHWQGLAHDLSPAALLRMEWRTLKAIHLRR